MTSAYALQEAIYAHLTADAALMARLIGVYDHVPQDAEYPYVRFGESAIAREQLSLMEVETISMTLHLASRSHSRSESDGVIQQLFTLLHNNANLNVAGYHLARLQLSQPEVTRGKDGASYGAEITITAIVTEI